MTRFYGINVFELTPGQKIKLLKNMHKIRAEEILRKHYSSLSPDAIYDLTLLVTEDRDAAEKAMRERILERLRQKNREAEA